MQKMYCPECSNYLMVGTGECVDCSCGWKQDVATVICECNTDFELLKQVVGVGESVEYNDLLASVLGFNDYEHWLEAQKIQQETSCIYKTYKG